MHRDGSDNSRKRGTEEARLNMGGKDDVEDTASSPLKPVAEDGETQKVSMDKKQLVLNDAPTNNREAIPPLPPQYVPPRQQKRLKKLADE
jgi:hypothetical protein